VHLNFQFREPLAPVKAPWSPSHFLRGLEAWQQSAEPYTAAVMNPGLKADGLSSPLLLPQNTGQLNGLGQSSGVALLGGGQPSAAAAAGAAAGGPEFTRVLQLLLQAQRGLVVIGEQVDSGAAAAAVQLAGLLGWPVAADVLSGLRVGSSGSSGGGCSGSSDGSSGMAVLHHLDHVLLPPPAGSSSSSSSSSSGWWAELQPDVVLQVGPRVTSKRVNQFMVSCFVRQQGFCCCWLGQVMSGGRPSCSLCSFTPVWITLKTHLCQPLVWSAPALCVVCVTAGVECIGWQCRCS
jgi:isochorismate synthase/2-succinyl-5-enolpyruvyl-6-hydroxy-3-cyclohexene-1-carboxylate synthase/2-succinyl-6-hydroxy-2,4-cyclohexadiene-1-carboxylate synthase/O-succinylbenzoate synthase